MTTRRRMEQQGHVWSEGGFWYVRFRETRLVGKEQKRVRVCEKLGTDALDETQARAAARERLKLTNNRQADVRGTMTLSAFVEDEYMVHIAEDLKPSTIHGYKNLWDVVEPYIGKKIVRDFRTVDAAELLRKLYQRGYGRNSLQRAKSFISGIFTHAKNIGALDGVNPVEGAAISKRATRPAKTHWTTAQEIVDVLQALEGNPQARAAVALCYFAGLRPGEARGVTWADYDGKQLIPAHSVWRTIITEPKTESSTNPVPVIAPLAAILAELRAADGNPTTGPILRGPRKGKPLNLANLARRVIVPALRRCSVCGQLESKHTDNGHAFDLNESLLQAWHGAWYAKRRGISTLATTIAKDSGQAAKGLLRHDQLSTTQRHYVGNVPEETQRALHGIEQLFAGKAHRA